MNIPSAPHWQPAQFWHPQGERIVCDLCPLHCRLLDGETGRCAVRRRTGPILETATHASAVRHLHSVERKPLYHFRPGLPTLTLAAPGCNFRCGYCQNAVLSQYGKEPDAPWRAEPVDPAEIVAAARAVRAAIAISYTEPTLAAELTLALVAAAQGHDIPLIWKSNGFITESALHTIAPHLAAINIDLKTADEAAHRRLTGAPLAPVLAAAAEYQRLGVWLEISTPLIDGLNTRPEQIRALAHHVAALGTDVPWHLVRVLPEYKMPTIHPTAPALLQQAQAIGREAGLRHVYVERACGPEGRQTRCPSCAAVVIERAIAALEHNHLINGHCPHCHSAIAGVWQGATP